MNRVGSTGPALIDRDVRRAHHAGRVLVGDVELVRHHLAERRAGPLAAVGLADIERRGVVLVNHDPRIELVIVGIGIEAARRALRVRVNREARDERAGADADNEHARRFEELAANHTFLPAARLMAA